MKLTDQDEGVSSPKKREGWLRDEESIRRFSGSRKKPEKAAEENQERFGNEG